MAFSGAAEREACPACHRIRDQVPAGFLTLSGEFLGAHKEEILHLVRNVERKENAEHPLERIMAIEERDGGVVISFTDPQLARGAGEAIRHAYDGEFEFHCQEEENLLRVVWRR